MNQHKLVGQAHAELVRWLTQDWLPLGPSVCFVEGPAGVGKTTVARAVQDAVDVPVATLTVPDTTTHPADDLMLVLAAGLSDAGEGTAADAVEEGKPLLPVIQRVLQKPLLVIIDEFQRALEVDGGRPVWALIELFAHLGKWPYPPGRVLLLSSRTIQRGRWSVPHEICTLDGLKEEEAVELLDQLLADAGRGWEAPAERRQEIANWLGGNPRAMRTLVAGLSYDSLDTLVGLVPEAWETRDRPASPEQVQELERALLQQSLGHLGDAFSHCLRRLAVHRIPFQEEAIVALHEDRETAARFRDEAIARLFVERHRGRFELHPIVREIGLQQLRESPGELQEAHDAAARHHTRHFAIQGDTGWGQLGGHFVEARHHLVNAGRERELGEIAAHFENHMRSTLTALSPIPESAGEIDERIAVLASLLETAGPKALENHLARLFEARGREGDLEQAARHARRATGPQAPAPSWVYCGRLVAQAEGTDEAVTLLKEGIALVAPGRNLFTLYLACSKLLAQAERTDEAIALLEEGIRVVPVDKSVVDIYLACGTLLARTGQMDRAVELLEQGITLIPAASGAVKLYRAYGEQLSRIGQTDRALALLKRGIATTPADKNLFSIYQACGELLARDGRTDEAIALLQEGMAVIPASKGLYSLYQICGQILTHAGRTDMAIAFLRRGLRVIPAGRYSRYWVAEPALLLTAAQRDADGLREMLVAGDSDALLEPQQTLGRVLLLQVEQRWPEAAALAGQSREHYETYLPLMAQDMFSRLCAGDAPGALRALEEFPRQIEMYRPHPLTWLKTFVCLRLGKQEEANRLLAGYLRREPDKPADEPYLLALWDRPSTPWDGFDLAYFFPTLPPSLTGLRKPVSRIPYHPSVLPAHVKGEIE